MSNSNQLAIITAKSDAKPPLKRTEIIEALSLRYLHQLREKRAAGIVLRDKAAAAFKVLALAYVRESGVLDEKSLDVNFRQTGNHATRELCQVNFMLRLSTIPTDLRRAFEAKTKLENEFPAWYSEPTFHEIKKGIREKMAGQVTDPEVRVKAMLANPTVVKALDRTLADLEKKPEAIPA